ncbi:small ribosomal subunit protein mS29 [Culicoides brevitarsis]|uniref:small ribosomal subunit protein mS29 n=1 Tax=Culicoides brevitarsis TaxID=469753 RepID=UPI00307C4EA0
MMLRRVLLPRSSRFLNYSTAAATAETQNHTDFRTHELDPTKHTSKHIGRFYKIPEDVKKQLFAQGGFPKQFEKQCKTFAESCLMVRQPAVEVINYLKQCVSVDKPATRFVLHGQNGAGKSLALAHITHYGYAAGFLLVTAPQSIYYYKWPKEHGPSATHEGYWDLPLDSAAWLMNFKTQNSHLLSNPELKCSQDYVWSKRETTEKGAPLLALIDHGINRVKFANDTIVALIEELKSYSTAGKIKTLVVIDGYNVYWQKMSQLRAPLRINIPTDKITMTKPMKSITDYNWTNGAVVVSVDKMAHRDFHTQDVTLPRILLGKKGFEHLDPFVPIEVKNYDDREYNSCIEYYLDRKWIQNASKGFDLELKHLSHKNPYELMRMCAPL